MVMMKMNVNKLIEIFKEEYKEITVLNEPMMCFVDINEIKCLIDEIERLNNIINEYENMKKKLLDYIYHNEYCRFGHIDGGEADEMRNILSRTDKLK